MKLNCELFQGVDGNPIPVGNQCLFPFFKLRQVTFAKPGKKKLINR